MSRKRICLFCPAHIEVRKSVAMKTFKGVLWILASLLWTKSTFGNIFEEGNVPKMCLKDQMNTENAFTATDIWRRS